nr:hypothetical protein [Tanacetum cinerariifolium]
STGRLNRGQGTNPQGGGAAGYGGVQNRVGNANPGQARQVKCYNCNGIGHITRNCTQPKHPQNSDYYKDKLLLMQAQENGVALGEEQLLFLASGQDTAIDEDVDKKPVQDLALNVDNVFQADDYPANDEAGPSYDSNILSEVHDHDHYQDIVCEHHEEHAMHDNVQLNHVVDSHADDTSDSNMIPYDQYVKDNAVPVVYSNVSSVPNDAYMMIYNDIYEPHAQSVFKTSRTTVVENSLTVELATYKEQVELYERRAMFELTERKQKINEQLRLVLSDRNFKEETLEKKLHSVKLQLASTINHDKLMVEEVTSLKKDFKQKENKYLEDFLDMKSLKEKVAIGYKNPLCLTRAKQVRPTLYNGHKIIKDNHVPAIVHNIEDTPEIAEITRRKMNDKMKDPECVNRKMKTEALKEQTIASRPIKALTMKNLLIANDNLIAECLSKEVFFVATNSELNVARFTKMHVANTIVETRCLELEAELSNLRDKSHSGNHDELVKHFSNLEHYKEIYDSIKITRAKHIEQVTALTTKNVNLKAQLLNTMNSVSKDHVKPRVLAPGKYAIDVEPIVPRLRNNREAHIDYLKHLKESVETIRDIVEEAKVVRPLDSLIVSACRYTEHSQELLEYAISTCPQDSHQRDKKLAPAPLIRKKQVTFTEQCDKSNSNTHKHVAKLNTQKTNFPVPPSTGVNRCTDASGSQPRSNTKKNRILPAKGVNKMQVEEQPRTNKSHLRTSNRVDFSSRPKRTVINSNLDSVCQTCNKCLISANHDMCAVDYLQSVVAPLSIRNNCNVVRKVKQVRQVWKPTGKGILYGRTGAETCFLSDNFVILIWKLHSGSILDMFEIRMKILILVFNTFMPPKPYLVFHDAPNVNKIVHTAFNVELSPTKPDKDLLHSHRPSAPIIEDLDSDLEDESEDEPTQNAPIFVQPTKQVKTPRPSVKPAEHPIPANNPKKDSPKSKGHSNRSNRKACFVCKSLTYLIKD